MFKTYRLGSIECSAGWATEEMKQHPDCEVLLWNDDGTPFVGDENAEKLAVQNANSDKRRQRRLRKLAELDSERQEIANSR